MHANYLGCLKIVNIAVIFVFYIKLQFMMNRLMLRCVLEVVLLVYDV